MHVWRGRGGVSVLVVQTEASLSEGSLLASANSRGASICTEGGEHNSRAEIHVRPARWGMVGLTTTVAGKVHEAKLRLQRGRSEGAQCTFRSLYPRMVLAEEGRFRPRASVLQAIST